MVSIHHDVDALKSASSLQRSDSQRPGDADYMAEESALLSSQPSGSGVANNTVVETTTHIPGTSWAEEMDIRDPLSDDDDSDGTVSKSRSHWTLYNHLTGIVGS